MLETVKELLQEVNSFNPKSEKEVDFFRLKFLGKKGKLNELFADFKSVPNESKKEFGQVINMLKQNAQAKVDTYKGTFETESNDSEIDLTRPVSLDNLGSRHPISLARNQIVDIFNRIGFTVSEGPEIEDDWHNFTALNLPEEHPARDMQDTFFIQTSPDVLLRTHTSSVQVRYMQENKPPIRTLSAGRVYRNEAISARAHCIFHQIEGLYINKNVSFADLKQALLYFAKEMFGEKTKIRLRPSFFPFTEPSAEVDVSCNICNSKGCNVCKYTGYLETLQPLLLQILQLTSTSARAHCIFHQIEGLYINKNVSFADLKQALLYFAKEMFGEKTKIRLRPSFFPFTEPSAEVDVSCNICNSKGCNVCKYTGYLEILGCGMVDPNVLENCGIDSKKYTGYAFGMGVERIAMLKYGVKDLRLFFENDVRFLKQFDKSI